MPAAGCLASADCSIEIDSFILAVPLVYYGVWLADLLSTAEV